MPFVLVTAAPLSTPERERQALRTVAAAVADGLLLRPEDVAVSLVRAAVGVLGDTEVTPWPVVVLHGSPRPVEQSRDAVARARRAVGNAWGRPEDEVWVQWAGSAP